MNKEVEDSLNEAIETINNGIEKSDIDYSVVRSLIAYAIWKLRKEECSQGGSHSFVNSTNPPKIIYCEKCGINKEELDGR